MAPDPDPSVEIDFSARGKAFGQVRFAPDDPGADAVSLPACVIAHGQGPTVCLWGGNHGDEYEGPIVLGELARSLDPARLQGRLIILPAINPPALAGQNRESPADGKNMNRIWPGNPHGSLSERIVDWLDRELLSVADVLMDSHTGGNATALVPMSMCHRTDDPQERRRIRAAQIAYDAPMSVELDLGPDRSTASARAHARGVLVVGSETGGGGPVLPDMLTICRNGIVNTLAHLGMLEHPATRRRQTRFTRKWGHVSEMLAESDGIFVPSHDLLDEAEQGAPAGTFHRTDRLFDHPETLCFPSSGVIAGRRARSGVRAGDKLYWIVRDIRTDTDG